jgi:[NiFe] hydrogenase diaphorase moiety small subunit
MTDAFILDGREVPFIEGQTIMEAALAAGIYIPHLCFHPELKPHGSCKLCTVRIDGKEASSCTYKAQQGIAVESDTEAINADRRMLLQMLFVEGNHFCPSCEQSGNCKLQASAYELKMMSPHFPEFYPNLPVDASHPEYLIDFNRCILCSLCVRASRDVDRKNVFALSGRGMNTKLYVNGGSLAQSGFSASDKAASVCPVGAILKKRRGFQVPIGQRRYDKNPISAEGKEK